MEKNRSIAFTLRNITNLVRREFEYQMTHEEMDNLTRMHGWALGYFCGRKGEDIFQKDFEQEFSIRPSTATRILQSMEKNGLITRAPVSYDARVKKILLTDKGLSLHQQAKSNIIKLERKLEQGLTKEELEIFFQVTEKIKDNLAKNC